MTTNNRFGELIQLARDGNEDAARELVATYEEQVRRFVRVRLTDPRLRVEVESADIVQSVMRRFFPALQAGKYDLSTPDKLVALLTTMALRDLLNRVDKIKRRPHMGSLENMLFEPQAISDRAQLAANQELLEQVKPFFTDQEWHIVEQRFVEGRSWSDLAKEFHSKPDALRMKVTRAIAEAVKRLDGEQDEE